MKVLKYFLFLILILAFSCQGESILLNPDNIAYLNKSIEHDYRIKKHYERDNKKWLLSIEYFLNNNLVERIWSDFRRQYFYDADGKLTKINYCRFNYCDGDNWEVMKYDKNNNLIGSFRTKDSIVNMNCVEFNQTKFYNSKNQLTKELSDTGTSTNGEKWEYWKSYLYFNNRIEQIIETRNNDTVWICKNRYNDKGNLIGIDKINGDIFENIIFKYDSKNRLIKESFESNNYPYDEKTPFSVKNYSTILKYNHDGKLISEITYNHNGEKSSAFFYEYNLKKY